MRATKKNKFDKIENNAKIREGECIFPFKYKWKTHNECLETKKGLICATSVNPKSKTLITYGYCPDDKNKKLNKTIKSRSKSRTRTRTRSRTRSRTRTRSRSRSRSSSRSSSKSKSRSSSRSSLRSNSKSLEVDLKVSPDNKVLIDPVKMQYNTEFIRILTQLKDIQSRKGEHFRARAYSKAVDELIRYKEPIYSIEQIKDLPNIGKTIIEKLNEFVETGTLQAIEREKDNPINILTKIYGVGPKKAEDLIKKGITTLEHLKDPQNMAELNDRQKIGLKYYHDINSRIPRQEIQEYETTLKSIFEKVAPPNSSFEICGSYRRGLENSGDIDMIITNKDNNIKAYEDFLAELIRQKILVEILSKGKTKSLTIGRLPDKTVSRRLDFLYAQPNEYAFAILYFTGSKEFNTVMRQHALNMQYTLNEHGLSKMINKVKAENVIDQLFPDEQSIFKFLNLKYKRPTERLDANALQPVNLVEEPEKEEDQPEAVKKGVMGETPPEELIIKVKKNKTLKQKQPDYKLFLDKFLKESIHGLNQMGEAELNILISEANKAYYCDATHIMTDNQYDILREYILEKYPDNENAKEGHAKCIIQKNKIKLPYEMWSMDKIKPDTDAIDKWIKKYTGPYIVSCKLDGVSGLYSTENQERKLYTRGNGTIGQDVSYLIDYLKLPLQEGLVIRGEFIIKKTTFDSKYAEEFANPRNFVAGVINKKTIDPQVIKDIDFVTYEVIKPSLIPSQQLSLLESLSQITSQSIDIVRYKIEPSVTNENLSQSLIEWRKDYEYEIDGIIVSNDKIYPRQSGNPEHAFAFKMVLSNQVAEAKVIDVIWTPSKDGLLKPRVQIEPITLGGVTINYATGFNAKFIEDNKIGIGALISIIRSGDVIPHIQAVIHKAPMAQMPLVAYEWNASRVDIIILDKTENSTVIEKNITGFFVALEVDGLGPGNVAKIINAGHNSVAKIIALQKEDFLKVEGFKDRLATKIHDNIQTQLQKASLPDIMSASNIFGRGFGLRKCKLIIEAIPDILTDTVQSTSEKIQKLAQVPGTGQKTATAFVEKIPEFIAFIKEAKLEYKIQAQENGEKENGKENGEDGKDEEQKIQNQVNKEHPLYNKKIVMTGFRDKNIINKIKSVGAELQSAITKTTFLVLVKDKDEDTGKANEARQKNIQIQTPEEFLAQYF